MLELLWIICLLLHLSENNVKITHFSLYLRVLLARPISQNKFRNVKESSGKVVPSEV
jgi:hypothetical protein